MINRAQSLDNLPGQCFLWDWQSFENCPLLIFKSNFTKRAESEDHLSGHKFLRDWKYFQKYSTYRYNLIIRSQSLDNLPRQRFLWDWQSFQNCPLLICKCSRAHSLDNLYVHPLLNIYMKKWGTIKHVPHVPHWGTLWGTKWGTISNCLEIFKNVCFLVGFWGVGVSKINDFT